jgi:PTS system nitrogen regulatory IIA component
MNIADVLKPRAVIPSVRAANKKQLLQEMSRHAADITGESEHTIFDVLLQCERLGTSGVGAGIAIRDGKIPGLNRHYALFVRLETPIDFDAIDEQPVDLIFLLLAPGGAGTDHLKALARISRLLRDRTLCEKLRGSDKAEALYALLTENATSNAA